MESTLITEEAYRNKNHIFDDRQDAGQKIGQKLLHYKDKDTLVLAIPSGGVPVAIEIAKRLNLPLDLIIVRKIQIPWNTEAGFGAINPAGEVIFNKGLLPRLGLTENEINLQVQKTKDVLKKRDAVFREGRPFPEIKDRSIIVVDDGLASGFTMLSALDFTRKRHPQKIIVAVPTALQRTVKLLLDTVDELVCLNIRSGFSFAVADAYRNWYDVTDKEVISILG